MLLGLLLKGKHICHVTINEHWNVRESISDGIHGRGLTFGCPTPISHLLRDFQGRRLCVELWDNTFLKSHF
jgi:hypothetical protein